MQVKRIPALVFLLFFIVPVFGQVLNDSIALARIVAASKRNSAVPGAITYLSDVYGPRLLGTANYYSAARWAKDRLAAYGADSVFFESFDARHRGWNVTSFNMEMTVPTYMHLLAYPLAYTRSTKGVVSAEVIYIEHTDSIRNLRGKLAGKMVLLGDGFSSFNALQRLSGERLSKEVLQQAAANPDPNDLLIGYHSRRSTQDAIAWQERRRTDLQQFFEFCDREGVVALAEASDYPYGILHSDGNHHVPSYIKQGDINPVPSFVVANEHFGRLVRIIKAGVKPVVKLQLSTSYNYTPAFNVNVVADIRGADKALQEQQVIIGAHLDSWHGGTGAVDNAAGCAVMMEALRLLKAAGLQPRRSVRLCLWGGEEQIFAGSRVYVKNRVGDLHRDNPGPDYNRISAYFNLDNGTGRIRGIYAQGNGLAKPILEEMLQPFASSNCNTVTLQNANQTDHELFDALNVPAFQFIQDPLNYISAVHHTNMDVAEYVQQQDLQESAILVAYLVYKVAMRDELLPRREFISVEPSLKGNTLFFLEGFKNARSVSLVSDFNNWNMFGTPLVKTDSGWMCRLNLKPGRYLFKYIVDGDWTADPKTPADKLLRDGKGHAGLTEVIVE
jgi:hypothetical protein